MSSQTIIKKVNSNQNSIRIKKNDSKSGYQDDYLASELAESIKNKFIKETIKKRAYTKNYSSSSTLKQNLNKSQGALKNAMSIRQDTLQSIDNLV